MGTKLTKDNHLWTRDTIKNLSGNVTLDIVGDLILNPGGNDLKISANADGTHALNIHNDGAGTFTIKADRGTENDIIFTNSSDIEICRIDSGVPALTFGGEAATYVSGGTDLNLNGKRNIVCTAASGFLFTGDGTEPGKAEFDNIAVGFDRILEEDDADVTVDFRLGNKAHLDMTGGSISGTLTLQFPDISANFVLVVQQDSSTRTIAAFSVRTSDGSVADNDGGTGGAIRWAGGSAPDLTDGGNKRDILSFYWDADEEVCYGVASLNF